MKIRPIRVVTLFSWFDCQCLGLEMAGIPYELVRWCEIDESAITAHNLIFPDAKDKNLGDITKVDWEAVSSEIGEIDLLTYSAPCTDISAVGKQAGIEKGSGTRSSLIWNVEDAIRALRPKWLLLENVRDLVGKKFYDNFIQWATIVNSYGYNTNWRLMDAQDYDCPQHRVRVFAISSRLDLGGMSFVFPPIMTPTIDVRDLLEVDADEKYYLNKERTDSFMSYPVIRDGSMLDGSEVGFGKPIDYCGKKEFELLGFSRDHAGKIINRHTIKVANTIHTMTGGGGNTDQYVLERYEGLEQPYRVRKITPRECFRIQGVLDKDIDKLMQTYAFANKDGSVSYKRYLKDSELYQRAGNGIAIPVLAQLFRALF